MEKKGELCLKKHKKEGIIAAISKLPMAMTRAFSPSNIIAGFVDNGMLASINSVLPSLKGLHETYRGNCNGTILVNHAFCVDKFYGEMFLKGHIDEKLYDDSDIPEDKNSTGEIVCKDFGISCENRQRSKVLSSKIQRAMRRNLIKQNRDKMIASKK